MCGAGGTGLKILDAIYRRKSVRDFMDNEIEEDLMNRIWSRLLQTRLLYEKSKIKFVISDYCKKSNYAPYYIGVYTDNTKEGKMNAGFVLQQLSIYLSAIGIASCYQAKSVIFKSVDAEGMKLAISMAVGYPENCMYRELEEIARMPLSKISVIKEKPNEEVERLLTLARIAPSCYNVQPWRFVVYHNRIHVFVKKKMLSRISHFKYVNMGIMLGNVCIGAEEMWIDIRFKEVADIKKKNYGDNEYILTILNKNVDGRSI